MEWPSYSPDLNPLENVWGYLKKEIAKKRIRTLVELEEALQELWNTLSNEYLRALISSVPKRVRLVIEKNGNRVPY